MRIHVKLYANVNAHICMHMHLTKCTRLYVYISYIYIYSCLRVTDKGAHLFSHLTAAKELHIGLHQHLDLAQRFLELTWWSYQP